MRETAISILSILKTQNLISFWACPKSQIAFSFIVSRLLLVYFKFPYLPG